MDKHDALQAKLDSDTEALVRAKEKLRVALLPNNIAMHTLDENFRLLDEIDREIETIQQEIKRIGSQLIHQYSSRGS